NYRVPWVGTFADVREGRPLLHIDSAGLMALAVRGGRAEEHFTLAVDSSVVISSC
ncbi:MAG: SAM-dependent chlorinase/fluorinase, partial [Acidimicrobiia bacterium]|nr:SAM-dependent chlorinase/fluorinase [Acidimicrobiia bacterium]